MPSTVRDRTQEFFATISAYTFNTIETINDCTKQEEKKNTSPEYIEQSQRIHNLTLNIDSNISNVLQLKLQHIKKLAKQTNNLHDFRADINALIVDVNEDLYNIDENIIYLKTVIENVDYWNNENCAKHHEILLNELTKRNEDLKSVYRSIYDIAINAMKKQKEERDSFPKIKASKRKLNRWKEYKINKANNKNVQIQRQEMLQINNDVNKMDYNELRLEMTSRIESELTSISQIAMDISYLVSNQGITMGIIDGNINKANESMDGAIGELQRYLARMTGNQWLMIKVFALIILFAVFFAIFIA